ncbi:MAG: cadherin-like domain-containing protein, partial [Rivularia sp. (in: Bacteria)]|nr:cadherin-like domain-containing protein [Rivularia sp. MS3]
GFNRYVDGGSSGGLFGGNGNDVIFGEAGNDTLRGEAGNDSLDGGDGDDFLNPGTGVDTVDGGAGNDGLLLDLSGETTDLTINFTNATDGTVSNGTSFQNIESFNLETGSGDDTVTTDASNSNALVSTGDGNDNIQTGAGDDRVEGGDGDDTIRGGAGDDGGFNRYVDGGSSGGLFGGNGNDAIFGEAGNDDLYGEAGNDTLSGVDDNSLTPGIGERDELSGGTGNDLFILGDSINIYYDDLDTSTNGDNDYATITDFNPSEDKAQLQGTASNYRLEIDGTDTNLYIEKPGNEPDELIAVFENVTNLDLESDAFIFVEKQNQAPVLATNDGLTLDEDAIGNITSTQLQVTDADNTAAEITYVITDVTDNGDLLLNGTTLALNDTFTQADIDNNLLTYDHNGSETTSDSFNFVVADGAGGNISSSTFDITVNPVNDAPVAVNDTATTDEDSSVTISVLANDTDAENNNLSITNVSNATGTVTIDGSNIVYNPNGQFESLNAGETATDTFTYSIDDGEGGTDTATVNVTINGLEQVNLPLVKVNNTAVSNPVVSYGGPTQDVIGTAQVSPSNQLNLTGNRWQRVEINSNITANTVLSFEFEGNGKSEIQGIGFDNDNNISRNNDAGQFFQVAGSQNWGITNLSQFIVNQSGNKDIYEIPVGEFFTGNFDFLTFANDDDQNNPDAEAAFSNIELFEDNSLTVSINQVAQNKEVESYGGASQDVNVVQTINNTELQLAGNGWKRLDITGYEINANTRLKFDFASNGEAEIQGIGFDNDNNISRNNDAGQFFQVAGSQNWGITNLSQFIVNQSGNKDIYEIPVGEFFTGNFDFLTFANDDDQNNPDAEAAFSNIELFEDNSLTVSINQVAQNKEVESYGGASQDVNVVQTINNTELQLAGNGWKRLDITGYEINANTRLKFDFASNGEAEIQGIGFDNDNSISRSNDAGQFFQVDGSQNWGIDIDQSQYILGTTNGFTQYDIPVGDFFTGEFDFLTIANDHDVANPTAVGQFQNITLIG